jgi:hypothetical protein
MGAGRRCEGGREEGRVGWGGVLGAWEVGIGIASWWLQRGRDGSFRVSVSSSLF